MKCYPSVEILWHVKATRGRMDALNCICSCLPCCSKKVVQRYLEVETCVSVKVTELTIQQMERGRISLDHVTSDCDLSVDRYTRVKLVVLHDVGLDTRTATMSIRC